MQGRQSGDTIVEVLIATAVLAMAVVGGLGVMNFGFGVILNAIERTQVQASVNTQLSLIQHARDSYIRADRDGTKALGKPWQDIMDGAKDTYANNVCKNAGEPDTSLSVNPFYMSETDATYAGGMPVVAPSVPRAGTGLWVEAVRLTPTTNYIDFYVKACWLPSAGTGNQESRSAMRLYVP